MLSSPHVFGVQELLMPTMKVRALRFAIMLFGLSCFAADAVWAQGTGPADKKPAPAARPPLAPAVKPVPRDKCVTKAGVATGITRGFAEYEALLIIRQVTGNWPLEKDRIGPAAYDCRQGPALWTCRAVAKVCRG